MIPKDPLIIVADRDIYRVQDYFQGLGELVLLPGADITSDHLQQADALLVRTVTPVNQALLAGSRVSFVGSASSGTDHVDLASLSSRGTAFAHAPGCNAGAVMNYVLAGLSHLSLQRGEDWRRKTVGIIGAGHVGGLLSRTLDDLGVRFCIYDPYLDRDSEFGAMLVDFQTAFGQDIVTLHCSLSRHGPYPSYHLIDLAALDSMADKAILVNAARGGVIANRVLPAAVGKEMALVMDVWEGEPAIDPDLAAICDISTAHIAGYSIDGKEQATASVHQAFCAHFSLTMASDKACASVEAALLAVNALWKRDEVFHRLLTAAYPIAADDAALRRELNDPDLPGLFAHLRNNYAFRREFSHFRVQGELPRDLARQLRVLGFQLT